MVLSGHMRIKKSTCLYLDAEVVETAREMGLNVSKVSENAMVEAIRRRGGPEKGDDPRNKPSFEGRDRDSDPGAGLHRPVG